MAGQETGGRTSLSSLLRGLRRGDRLMLSLALFFLILATALFLYRNYAQRPDVLHVEILQDGQLRKSFYIEEGTESQAFTFHSASGCNVVRAEGGRVAIVGADCPDKDCVRMGWLDRPGESAVCLPHRFVLRIRGASAVDAVTF